MKKYQHKRTGEIVEAVTFDELVEHGREQNPGHYNLPQSFEIWGRHVTNETSNCYLVDNTRVHRGQVLVHQQGNIYVWEMDSFKGDFAPVEETLKPTEDEMIEATEKSAGFMLGLAARARTAARLEEENDRLRTELKTAVEDKLKAQRELKDTQNYLAARPVRDAQAIADLRQTLDAEGYELPALATIAIQKVQDLDQGLTDAKVNDKRLREERNRLAAKLDAQEDYIENQCRVPWEQLQAALPEPGPEDDRSLVQRVLDAIKVTTRAPAPKTLKAEITRAINRFSAENGSDTPDFILADYLMASLDAFDAAVTKRSEWYNKPADS